MKVWKKDQEKKYLPNQEAIKPRVTTTQKKQ